VPTHRPTGLYAHRRLTAAQATQKHSRAKALCWFRSAAFFVC